MLVIKIMVFIIEYPKIILNINIKVLLFISRYKVTKEHISYIKKILNQRNNKYTNIKKINNF